MSSKVSRFSNNMQRILQDKGYAYFNLKISEDLILRQQEMIELYHLYSEITTQMLGLPKLKYTIYYKNNDGKILRIETDDVSKAANIWEGQKNSLRLQGNNIQQVFNQELEDIKNETAYTDALTSHYKDLETILKASYGNKDKKYSKYIPEAFERDILHYPHTIENIDSFSQHKWSVEEAWYYLKESSGNAPWYSGGDVLSKMFNVQVKGFTQGKEDLSGKNPFFRITGLTSLRSLEDIANYLISLLNVAPETLEQTVNEVYSLFNQESWEHKVDYNIEQDVEKMTKKITRLKGDLSHFNLTS